jgi:hypothetical protein
MKNNLRNAVFAIMIGACCYQIGRIAEYKEIRERANISHQFGEGYFTAIDVEEIVEGYED